MHGYKWPINCTRTRTGAAAEAGTAWEEGATIGIRAEVRRSLTCLDNR